MSGSINKEGARFFFLSSIIIAVISFLAYFNAINSFFSGCDFAQLYFGKYGKISDILRLIIRPGSQDVFIRPLSEMNWLLEHRLWGINPAGYHIANIALHSINSILVLLLSFFLLKDKIISLGAALLFAIQPLHSGTVSLTVRTPDLMCTLFCLLSLVSFALYVYKPGQRFFYYLSIIAYPLALFSKEMAITLPLAIILYGSFLEERFSLSSIINRINRYTPYITITIIYLTWRLAFTGSVGGDINPVTGRSSFFDFNPPEFISKAAYYIPLELFIPVNHSILSRGSIRLITAVFASGIVISILLFWKEILKKGSLVLFTFLWVIITLLPAHNLVGESNFPGGARLIYLPSAGLCIVLAFILLSDKTKSFRRYVSSGIFVVFCIFYFSITVKYNSIWIKAGEISRSIPRLVNDYYKRYGVNIRYYFLIPDTTKEGVEVFSNDLLRVLAPVFAPVKPTDVILLTKEHAADNTYAGAGFDFRDPQILGALGEETFFFNYDEDRAVFEELSTEIKSRFLKRLNAFRDFKIQMPGLYFSGPIESGNEIFYASQSLNIPASFVGGIEVRMRLEGFGYQDVYNFFWYRDNKADYLPTPFTVDVDGRFHTYRVPFRIYSPDWTQDAYITKIEACFPYTLPDIDIDYIKLLPYER